MEDSIPMIWLDEPVWTKYYFLTLFFTCLNLDTNKPDATWDKESPIMLLLHMSGLILEISQMYINASTQIRYLSICSKNTKVAIHLAHTKIDFEAYNCYYSIPCWIWHLVFTNYIVCLDFYIWFFILDFGFSGPTFEIITVCQKHVKYSFDRELRRTNNALKSLL